MTRPLRISVIGGGRATADELATAESVGRAIAQAGAVLVCGGLGGVMEAAAHGAREAGGLTVGILPGYDAHVAAPDILVPIVTGMHEARNVIVAASGDAVIAVGGSLGTLTEIGFALKLRRPVIGLGTWSLDPSRVPADARFIAAETPEAAVAAAVRACRPADEEE